MIFCLLYVNNAIVDRANGEKRRLTYPQILQMRKSFALLWKTPPAST
ncbi:MAG: hypothetical protein ACLUJR_11110 [Mediterraneibacter gnavus]